MSFSEDLAKLVTDQLTRFVTLNRHQLAGHVANLEFWLDQVRHALTVIDGYQERFRQLKAGQAEFVAKHQITIPSHYDSSTKEKPVLPRRVPDDSLREARRDLADATYRFLLRLYKDDLISESHLRSKCESLKIGIDPADIKHLKK